MNLIPRNSYVVLQLVQVDESEGGVAVPQISAEAKRWFVVAIGPKVENLKVGDQVEAMGTVGEDIARLPGHYDKGLYITKEANILLVIGKE